MPSNVDKVGYSDKINEIRDNTICNCKYNSPRNIAIQKAKQPLSGNEQESICSEQATRRGAGQRVISFAMFGDKNKDYI